MNEVWRAIPGYGGHYEASSEGRIRVKDRYVEKRHGSGATMRQFYPGRLLSPTKTGRHGHLGVHLGFNGERVTARVHRLVLLAFVGACPEGMEGCHSNGNAADNRPDNLRWDTHLENNRDRKRHGRYATGAAHNQSKFDEGLLTSVRAGAVPLARAMKVYGMSRTHFYRVRNGY